MNSPTWHKHRAVWSGDCPRCGKGSFFGALYSHPFADGTTIDVVECPGGHPFVICSKTSTEKLSVVFVQPIADKASIPSWLPEEYHAIFSEMTFDFLSGKYRSTVALAGIMLDAHINSLLKYNGDRKKNLKKRLEILVMNGRIDQDQFADATIARLARNETVHPKEINEAVLEADARDVMEAVTGCLERFYKWRRAKALPAPTEQTADPATPPDPDEKQQDEK